EGKSLTVTLVGEGVSGWGKQQKKGFISLTGPEDMNLEITNSSGPMFVSDVSGEKIGLKTSSGKIDARQLDCGEIHVTASSGEMDLEKIQGRLFCKTSSGGGTISQVEGNVSLVASSGSYKISRVEGI